MFAFFISTLEGGRQKIYESGVVSTLLKVFVNTNIRDTDEFLIHLISTLTAESDEVKLILAESSVDMHLLSIISVLSSSPTTGDDERLLVKAASELLVLVLTGGLSAVLPQKRFVCLDPLISPLWPVRCCSKSPDQA